jgi:hypothetical protein
MLFSHFDCPKLNKTFIPVFGFENRLNCQRHVKTPAARTLKIAEKTRTLSFHVNLLSSSIAIIKSSEKVQPD